ncbi:MAG: hypothetical protein U1E86_28420 [Burkholderiaceae bacterium]
MTGVDDLLDFELRAWWSRLRLRVPGPANDNDLPSRSRRTTSSSYRRNWVRVEITVKNTGAAPSGVLRRVPRRLGQIETFQSGYAGEPLVGASFAWSTRPIPAT